VIESVTSVRDGPESPYTSRAVLDETALASIRETNLAFLALLAGAGSEALGIDPVAAARIRTLDAAALATIADCPYTLFNLRFEDADFWRGFGLETAQPWQSAATERVSFVRMAVFLAWHLARSNELAASLVLGMTPDVQRAWRSIPLSVLERAAPGVLPHLQARWGRHPTFWIKLLSTAAPATRERADAVRLLGLQLLAADGAWPAGGAAVASRFG
jgi:hypothetical protein